MLEAVPYQVHTDLTDNRIQFAEQPRNRNTIYSRPMRFDMICEANGIEHRLTKPNHPWANGQVERMNRTIKDATVKRFHYDSHDQLRSQWDRAPADQAQPPLDERPGRADEPHHQGRHGQALPLRKQRPLRTHLADFMAAYNFARRLKTLGASRHTNTSARSGPQSQIDSSSTRSTRCRA